jgi:hypothetical protein
MIGRVKPIAGFIVVESLPKKRSSNVETAINLRERLPNPEPKVTPVSRTNVLKKKFTGKSQIIYPEPIRSRRKILQIVLKGSWIF